MSTEFGSRTAEEVAAFALISKANNATHTHAYADEFHQAMLDGHGGVSAFGAGYTHSNQEIRDLRRVIPHSGVTAEILPEQVEPAVSAEAAPSSNLVNARIRWGIAWATSLLFAVAGTIMVEKIISPVGTLLRKDLSSGDSQKSTPKNRENWRMRLVGEKDNLERRLHGYISMRNKGCSKDYMEQLQIQWNAIWIEVQTYNKDVENYNSGHYVGTPHWTHGHESGPSPRVFVPLGYMEKIDLVKAQKEWDAPQVLKGRFFEPRGNSVCEDPKLEKK